MARQFFIKDKNLKSENIKKDITILNVIGTYEGGSAPVLQSKTVDVSTSEQVVTPDQGYDGLSSVTVNKVQGIYEIDQYTYTQSSFYKSVYDKALVHYYDPKVAAKTVDPSTSQQTFNPLNEQVQFYNGITVNAVDASIDSNIQAENIKKDVTILGVTGTYESSPVQPVLQDASLSYTQNGTYTLNASSGYDGLGTVTVDVSVASSGGSDWLVDALAGNITDLSGYTLPASNRQYQYKELFYNKQSSITKSPVIGTGNETAQGQNAYYAMFKGVTTLTHLDFSGVYKVSSQTQCGELCNGCTNLTTIDFSNLQQVGSRYVFSSAFTSCPNLKTAIIHPEALKFEANIDNVVTKSATALENISFSAMAVNSIQLNWQPNLTANSVLEVLTHLDPNVSGKTVTFYTGGLTVTDYQDGRIQAAYDTAVAAGWTISNLTITPYS